MVRIKQRKWYVKYGIWYVRSLCRAGSLTAAARELARCKLVLWACRNLGGKKRARLEHGIIIFFYRKGEENHQLGTKFFVNYGIVSAVKRLNCDNDSYYM